MHKIYSRPRIKIHKIEFPKEHPINNKTNRKVIKILIVILIAILTVKVILDSVLPIFDTLCKDKAKSIATIVSNEQATEVMKKHSYDELFTIEKDSNGNISMIKSNVISINEIISDVPNKIQEKIDSIGRDDVEIALGSFTGISLLSGRGPGIGIRISTIGNVETELKSEFIAQGINQTLHKIYLQVNCEVNILTPYHTISQTINNQVLIMENVIVGNVPSTYYNLEGIENRSEALEIIE